MRIRPVMALLVFMVFSLGIFAQSDTGGVKQDTKDAAHDTAKATKKAGHKAKKGTKKVVHKGAHATSKGADKVEDKTKPSPTPPPQ